MKYIPQPIDTRHIQFSEDICELSEMLAKNTHEVWAQSRMEEGWVYGERRNDAKKEHPCLIPYEKLAESEKYYDRKVSEEILKVIISLGYEIRKK